MLIARPECTMPEAEAAALAEAYRRADTVLEYGSGGSTVVAAEAGAEVWAVESDAAWAQMMQGWFAQNPAKGRAHIHHADIGPTKEWGHPRDESQIRKWPDYALSIWESAGFRHPDVILVDGRFRLACFMTALYRITRPVVLFFDDYAPRPAYHKAEALLAPSHLIGRMARFDLTPVKLTPDRMRAYVKALLQPV
ncbi:hypothetical protein Q9295_03395 [Xinfangfangia sp. CPCC 101601]|uniref:Class I SAM-dependent methyltransferase n=1 Tax=Pseudogemmobacter lacusdianii TaxID=3069608 RepID=A0ABU0VUJ6_9RHOB|nr:hypothetical protein [Xinfangfangia sp. CPCC 101601]MDQ2065406.1 hypothetical protein [Xinfangfangia sp. CPCC 101601]